MNKYNKSILKPRKKIKYCPLIIDNFIQEVKHLTYRLFLQATRRPANIISGLIQPILWLFLFGALFKNVPLNLFNTNYAYSQFLSCGILIFTCFTGALNAGLPLIFDREFGFLNRFLVAPLVSRNAIILASIIFIVCITMLQNLIILSFNYQFFCQDLDFYRIQTIVLISILITIIISNISLGLAFILPGHIEFLALILIINLPTLFASTALAPLYLMPYWLQIIAKLNILTYAIEAVRSITINNQNSSSIIYFLNFDLQLRHILILFTFINFFSIFIFSQLIHKKLN